MMIGFGNREYLWIICFIIPCAPGPDRSGYALSRCRGEEPRTRIRGSSPQELRVGHQGLRIVVMIALGIDRGFASGRFLLAHCVKSQGLRACKLLCGAE